MSHAIIYDSPVTDTKRTITYSKLRDLVALFAGALVQRGIEQGDRVIIYMPMIPEAVVAMLACARIGAVHSVVFGGFAANELAVRIDDAKPKAIIAALSASGLPRLDLLTVDCHRVNGSWTINKKTEPRRVCRRLQTLRGWSHGNEEEVTEIFT